MTVNRQTLKSTSAATVFNSVVPSGARVAVLRPRAFNQSEGMGEEGLPTQGAGAKSGLAPTTLQSTPGKDVRQDARPTTRFNHFGPGVYPLS